MATPPRVYADFNAIEYERDGSCYARLALTGYGTLASLSRQRLRLAEALEVVLFEPGDIECDARVHFDLTRQGPAGIVGEWVAVIPQNNFRSATGAEDIGLQHPCFGCGTDLEKSQPVGWRSYREACPDCGTPVMAPPWHHPRVRPNPSLEPGPPPAWHLAREALQVIIRLAGQAPLRLRPLSSNVRPRREPAIDTCSP